MELEDLESRIKELDVSIVEMKELIAKNKQEIENFVKQKNSENDRALTAIVENQGRKKELQKLIDELKKEEKDDEQQPVPT